MVILDGNTFGCKKIVPVRKALLSPTSITFVLFLLAVLTSFSFVL